MKLALIFLLALLTIAQESFGTPVINVGNYSLLPNTPNQQISIPVSGGDAVQGLNLLLQTGDGGSALGGVDGSAPKVQDISITTGTMFAGNNTGRVFDDVPADELWQIHTTTTSGTVPASGVLAVVTLDTTGFMSGSFPLLLGDIGGDTNADTDFAGVPATIFNGTISVPEPASTLWILTVACTLLKRRRPRCPDRASA